MGGLKKNYEKVSSAEIFKHKSKEKKMNQIIALKEKSRTRHTAFNFKHGPWQEILHTENEV